MTSLSNLDEARAQNGPESGPEFTKYAWTSLMSPEGLGNFLGGPVDDARY